MPQLWLTYDEMAEELGCQPAEAREAAIARAMTRKHSSDGFTRVLMPPDLMHAYFVARALDPLPSRAAAPPPLEQLRRIWSRPQARAA